MSSDELRSDGEWYVVQDRLVVSGDGWWWLGWYVVRCVGRRQEAGG